MSFVGDLIGDVAGGILGTKQQTKAAQASAATLAQAAQKGIAAVQDSTAQGQAYQSPYLDAGSKAIAQQMTLLGLNGTAGQQDAVQSLLQAPDYTTAVRQGEEAILQNASATGGLRGGNVQNSLANFRADQLGNVYQRYFQNLGSLTGVGQNAANTSAALSADSARAMAGLYGEEGGAIAGGNLLRVR